MGGYPFWGVPIIGDYVVNYSVWGCIFGYSVFWEMSRHEQGTGPAQPGYLHRRSPVAPPELDSDLGMVPLS